MLYGIVIFMLMAGLSHPFVMIMLLVSVCLSIVCVMSGVYGATWLGLVLALVILGGLMILFLFMASMSKPSEFYPVKWRLLVGLSVFTFLVFMLTSSQVESGVFIVSMKSLSLLFMSHKGFWFVFLILYLLYSLVVVMELMLKTGSPVRCPA